MRRAVLRAALGLLGLTTTLAGCVTPYDAPSQGAAPLPDRAPVVDTGPLSPQEAARAFVGVADRMEPYVEQECLALTRGVDCDFQIVVDARPGQPANAYQTLDASGRPVIAFTVPLIAEARNADELAFVMGHEAAHHIAGHIPRAQQTATLGATIFGGLAAAYGADATGIRSAQQIGATVGARSYSKDFELEADRLGTIFAWRAGYDPERGAEFFARIPDPGNRFLGSHPPNAARIETVRRTLAQLRAGLI